MAADCPKQFLRLGRYTVLEWAVRRLLGSDRIAGAVIAVTRPSELVIPAQISGGKPVRLCQGGRERWESVLCGLDALMPLADARDWVLVHDAARPCIRTEDVSQLCDELAGDDVGGLVAIPVTDTIKQSDDCGRVIRTVPRRHLWRAQTPQMFRLGMLHEALERVRDEGVAVTDEASAMEYCGHTPRLVTGRQDNIKITRPGDLDWAGWILRQQGERCE